MIDVRLKVGDKFDMTKCFNFSYVTNRRRTGFVDSENLGNAKIASIIYIVKAPTQFDEALRLIL